jgi:MFS family permease
MYSESDVEAAVAGGALTPDQAASFRNFVAAGQHSPAVDEEHFRLLTGFNDVFVAIAAAILLVAVGWIGQTIPPHIEVDGPSPFAGLFVAITAWGLAEFFTRQRRMALPSILLLVAFAAGVGATAVFTLVTAIGPDYFDHNAQAFALALSGGAAIAGIATYLHWRRFRVPVTVAVGVGAAVALVLGIIASMLIGDGQNISDARGEQIKTTLEAAGLVLGLGTFLLAMWWDGSDPRRETRRSDVAFWLHLLAAPLIVHPIFSLLGLTEGKASTAGGVVVILLYVALGIVALAIDRRALLVSALAYVLFALNSLFETYGVVELNVALTALIIGSALLLLSAFWSSARRAVVKPLPGGLQARLPVLDRSPLPMAAATA